MLLLKDISKRYPGIQALDGVSLTVERGEVHALVGGNGAGKSTLIKIAAGAVTPDGGQVEVDGEPLAPPTPVRALQLGVRVIHQEHQIAPDLSVAENVLLGQMPARIGWRSARRRVLEVLDRVGLDLDPRHPTRDLGVHQLQLIEIARALYGRAKLLIMDEPTAALDGEQIARLLENVRRLRDAGVGVVYISHHLDEVFGLADRITVLRDGRRIATLPAGKPDHNLLVELMFGQDIRESQAAVEGRFDAHGDAALVVRGLTRLPALRRVDITARRGEIICITGGIGSGRRELARCLVGRDRPTAGTISVNGHDGPLRSPRHAASRGIAFVPEDRKRDGLLMELDITDNIAVSREAQRSVGILRPRDRRRRARNLCGALDVKAPSVRSGVRTLSGGNQQKVLLARCMDVEASVLVLDEPTAGIDVRTKFEIYHLLRTLARDGGTVVAFSSDYEEIELLADRALVLRDGEVVADLPRAEISEERLLAEEHKV